MQTKHMNEWEGSGKAWLEGFHDGVLQLAPNFTKSSSLKYIQGYRIGNGTAETGLYRDSLQLYATVLEQYHQVEKTNESSATSK